MDIPKWVEDLLRKDKKQNSYEAWKIRRKKIEEDGGDDFLIYATDVNPPPLFGTLEIDGIIVKDYRFIRDHSSYCNSSTHFSVEDFPITNYPLLSSRKLELEKQIELNYAHYVDQCNLIKWTTIDYLKEKFELLGRPLRTSKEESTKISAFSNCIHSLLISVIEGTEIYWKNDELFVGGVLLASPTRYKTDLFAFDDPQISPTRFEVAPNEYGISNSPVPFVLYEFMVEINKPTKTINRIITRSVPLYFEYVKIHSLLYSIDLNKIISEIWDNKSDYGIHQKYNQWIAQTFKTLKEGGYPKDEKLQHTFIKEEIQQVKGNGLSDNRVAQQVSILYSYEKERSIDKSHVKRIYKEFFSN